MTTHWAVALLITAIGAGLSPRHVVATGSSGMSTPLNVHARFDELNLHAHAIPANQWGAHRL